jgi:acyl-CoA reductase-like NAD-dependent aldehyde dehydrogenase
VKHSRTKNHHEITQDLFAKEEILGEASLFQMNTTFSLQDPDLFRQRAFVAGRWCDADSGATLEVNNPATGEILGTVPKMGANETWRAIEAAKDAFVDWSRKPAKERSILMRRWHDLIMANLDDIGALMTAEQGKPLTEAKGEVAAAAGHSEVRAPSPDPVREIRSSREALPRAGREIRSSRKALPRAG